MNIGFIGLGVMGRPMALNLLRAGHALTVWGRRAESVRPLVEAGARAVPTPAALGGETDVVFTMVTAEADLKSVLLGADGAAAGMRPGSALIDMETISPSAAAALAHELGARGIDMLDAPVSGGPTGAEQGSLSIMVGGAWAVLERLMPLLKCLGRVIVHMGGHGAGQTAKACNQLALLVAAQGVAEALTLARRSGIDPASVREVMLGGVASSRVLELFGRRMVERDFSAGIEARLYHKDLNIVLGLAHSLGLPLPGAAVVMQHLNAVTGRGDGSCDLSVIVKVLEAMAASGADRQ
jgi:3-hydroxyisobutyrate dehydrogenase-like beta-hydroxyacid dehydrogenase